MKPKDSSSTQKTVSKAPSRREILKGFAGAGALTGVALPHVHSQVDDTVQIALVGCGGRGTGAAHNALQVSAANGPTKTGFDG